MSDWAASISETQRRRDHIGWAAAAVVAVGLLGAGMAIAMRLQAAESARSGPGDAMLLDLPPVPPAVTARPDPAPDMPMTDAPDAPSPPAEVRRTAEQVPRPERAARVAAPAPMADLPAMPDVFSADLSVPPPEPEVVPDAEPEPTPQPKPKAAKREVKPAAAPAPTVAAPKAAPSQKPSVAAKKAVTAGQTQKLADRWGAAIRTKIQRRNRYPDGADGATGTVLLRLQVGRDGVLASVGIAQSSGHPVLDDAAVQAVRRVGRFAAAPGELTDTSYVFTLPLTFAR